MTVIVTTGVSFPSANGSVADYLIALNGPNAAALNVKTGNVDFSDTNHANVFQQAINALKAGNGGLVGFKGQYTFTGPINLYSGIGLVGAGPNAAFSPLGSFIKSTYNGSTIVCQMDAANNRQSFPYLANFAIVGVPNGTLPLQNLIEVNDTPGNLLDLYLDRVLCFWAGQYGLLHPSQCKTWLDGCYIEDCNGDGIHQTGGFLAVVNSYIHGNGAVAGHGINSGGSAGALWAYHNRFNWSTAITPQGSAILVGPEVYSADINDNWFANNGTPSFPQLDVAAWSMSGKSSLSIEGNTFLDERAGASACSYHVRTSGSQPGQGTISGNRFVGATNSGKPVSIGANAANKWTIKGNTGLNDTWGKIATPFATATVGIEGSSAAPTASTAYAVSGTDLVLNVSGGTGVSMTIKDPAGNTLASGLTTLTMQVLPVGYSINFGAFSVAPTASCSVA